MKRSQYLLFFLILSTQCIFAQSEGEILQINWPKEYNWTLTSNQRTDSTYTLQYLPEGEKVDDWHIMGWIEGFEGLHVDKMEDAMNHFFESTRAESPKAKLTHLKTDNSAKTPWILFKIETESFLGDPNPESQLFYLVQTESFLHVCFMALKEKQLPDELVAKFSRAFTSSTLLSGSVPVEQAYQQYYDEADKFYISFPQHWKYVRQQDNAIKLFVYRTKETPADIPRENVNLNFISAPNANVDEGYAKLKNALLKGGSQLVEEGEFEVDHQKVKWLIETHQNKVSGEPMKNYSFAYYVKNRTVIMTCTALLSTFDKHKATFEKIARSLRI